MAKKEEVRKRLDELEEDDGFLDLEVVIDAARNPEDILHEYFTWDDAQAAHERRRDQARHLIASVRYVETTTRVELAAKKYVTGERITKRAGYYSLDHVKQNEEFVNSVLNDELKRARGAVDRALAVADVLGVKDKLEEALGIITDLQKLVA